MAAKRRRVYDGFWELKINTQFCSACRLLYMRFDGANVTYLPWLIYARRRLLHLVMFHFMYDV